MNRPRRIAFPTFVFLNLLAATATAAESRNTADRPAVGTAGMISTAHPLATQAGWEILRAGGNAFDATVAVAAVLGVVEPMMSGIGGYGALLVHDARTRETKFLDCSGRIPAAVDADVFRPPTPGYLENRRGAKSVSTPGNVNGWTAMLQRHGTMELPRLLAAAIRLAEEGFVIGAVSAGHIAKEFEKFPPHARAIYGVGGRPLRAGERLVQKDLGRSLRAVAKDGARALHGGELGEAVVRTMRETGGFVSLEDLRTNRAEWWDPVRIDYRGCQVLAAGSPTNGWNVLLRIGIMTRWDLPALGHNSVDYVHRFAEVTKRAYAARLVHAGDPDVSPPPLGRLLSAAFWAAEAAAVDLQRAVPFVPPGPSAGTGTHTTHFVVADAAGNVVSATQTLGDLFGSKVMVEGTGVWLNNSLSYSTFEPKGNPMDVFPGRRKLAGYCPVIIFRDGRPWVALGTPGGHTIVQTTPQIVMNLIDFGFDMQRAVAAPRLSFIEPALLVVDEAMPAAVRAGLTQRGHTVEVRKVGNAHGLTIEYDAAGRPVRFTGGADPRGEGVALGY
ncbi:MAG: gamma-glutamyltransferase [Opitutaceae bacterium]|nr:gamma-glutamyltransferase [Opitutaceae bacterium]